LQKLDVAQRKILQGMRHKIIVNFLTGMNLTVKWHIFFKRCDLASVFYEIYWQTTPYLPVRVVYRNSHHKHKELVQFLFIFNAHSLCNVAFLKTLTLVATLLTADCV